MQKHVNHSNTWCTVHTVLQTQGFGFLRTIAIMLASSFYCFSSIPMLMSVMKGKSNLESRLLTENSNSWPMFPGSGSWVYMLLVYKSVLWITQARSPLSPKSFALFLCWKMLWGYLLLLSNAGKSGFSAAKNMWLEIQGEPEHWFSTWTKIKGRKMLFKNLSA